MGKKSCLPGLAYTITRTICATSNTALYQVKNKKMHFIQLLVPTPFVIITIRLILQRYIQCSDEAVYMRATRELAVACLCGPVLLTSLYSRLFTTTPYLTQENECLSQFLLIQLFSALLEFRSQLQDIGMALLLLGYVLYVCQTSVYWQTMLYWLMVFHILRTPETILLVLWRRDGVQRSVYATAFDTLKNLEFVVLFTRAIELYVFREPAGEGTLGDMAATVAFMTFAYGQKGRDMFVYHIFHRDIQHLPSTCIVSFVPEDVRKREDELMKRLRASNLLYLANQPSPDDGDDTAGTVAVEDVR